MATAIMKERLRLAAARCIVHHSTEWWSSTITEGAEFDVANDLNGTGQDLTTPEDTANFLLLCAEAL